MIDFNIRDYVREALPDGRYTFLIKKTEMKPTKGGDPMASLHLKVTSAFRTGQVIIKNFNIYNPSEIAQRMAREELAAVCNMVGVEDLKNLNQLEGLTIDAEVIKTEYNGKPSNEVKKFFETVNKSASMNALSNDAPFDDDIKF